jgi:hypothetical protein
MPFNPSKMAPNSNLHPWLPEKNKNGKIYQIATKFNKLLQNILNGHKDTDMAMKSTEMSMKNTKVLDSKAFQNLPELSFLLCK